MTRRDDWIEKLWYIYTIDTTISEKYLVPRTILYLRKEEIMQLAAMWMHLEGTVLSEVSHSDKEEFFSCLGYKEYCRKIINNQR